MAGNNTHSALTFGVLVAIVYWMQLTVDCATPSATALQAQLDEAIAKGAEQFVIPAGVFNFSDSNFNVSNAVRIHVVGTDVTLVFQGTAGVNVSNSDSVNITGLSITYDDPPHGRRGVPGITYNLMNCSNILSEDITIHQAPFFAVTAFNGGGGHTFRRVHLPNDTAIAPGPDPFQHQRDGFHFSDLRRGVLVENCDGTAFGDDFFNAHNTIMVVLGRDMGTDPFMPPAQHRTDISASSSSSSSPGQYYQPTDALLIINPHLQNVQKGRNTVYGTNCVLENLRCLLYTSPSPRDRG